MQYSAGGLKPLRLQLSETAAEGGEITIKMQYSHSAVQSVKNPFVYSYSGGRWGRFGAETTSNGRLFQNQPLLLF